jgi:exopolyphosphatase/guanosine-5'-triphosphate,3'-diphosphate pyrophosphatase
MFATIDVGSNTVRMLIGNCRDGVLFPHRYERRITRLAGDFSAATGLAADSRTRTLAALAEFSRLLQQDGAHCLRAVGTAALRRANNSRHFIEQVERETGLSIEVIDGDEEARLTTAGVLSVITPTPPDAVIFDIGGGSTELVRISGGVIRFQRSYPFGVVRLAEEYSDQQQRQRIIDAALHDCQHHIGGAAGTHVTLIGTAGTMTTLAAVDLGLRHYDPQLINNHQLPIARLRQIAARLAPLTIAQRESLAGMEPGRGDLILPGIQIAAAVAKVLASSEILIADAGLLEGTFLRACRN